MISIQLFYDNERREMPYVAEFRRKRVITLLSICIFIFGVSVLYRNEGQDVKYTMTLQDALNNATTLDPNEEYEMDLEGCVVHVAGAIITGQPLTEPDHNIQIQAVKLRRRVFMYQWVEDSMQRNYGESGSAVDGDSVIYYYSKEWRDEPINSRHFYNPYGHTNPERFPIESRVQISDAVYIGKYELSDELKDKFISFEDLTSDTRPDDPNIKMHSGYYYHTNDVFNPQIGDLRILFSFAGLEGEYYTVMGKLQNKKIVPYRTNYDVDFLVLHPGEHSMLAVFRVERSLQRYKTWLFRMFGLGFIFLAVTGTSGILNILLTNSELFRFLIVGRSVIIGNVMLAVSLTLVIISICWMLYRPIFAGLLLIAAGAPYVWGVRGVINYDPLI